MNTLIQTSPEQSRTRILRKTFLALAVVLALTVGRVNAQIPMLTWAPETSGAYDYGTVTVGQPVSQRWLSQRRADHQPIGLTKFYRHQ